MQTAEWKEPEVSGGGGVEAALALGKGLLP